MRDLMDNPMSPEAIKARAKAKRKEEKRKRKEAERAEAEAEDSLDGTAGAGAGGGAGAASPTKAKAGNMVNLYYLYEGLEPGYEYRFRVAATSSVGQGDWSATTWSTMTKPTRPGVLSAPKSTSEREQRARLTRPGSDVSESRLAVVHTARSNSPPRHPVF